MFHLRLQQGLLQRASSSVSASAIVKKCSQNLVSLISSQPDDQVLVIGSRELRRRGPGTPYSARFVDKRFRDKPSDSPQCQQSLRDRLCCGFCPSIALICLQMCKEYVGPQEEDEIAMRRE